MAESEERQRFVGTFVAFYDAFARDFVPGAPQGVSFRSPLDPARRESVAWDGPARLRVPRPYEQVHEVLAVRPGLAEYVQVSAAVAGTLVELLGGAARPDSKTVNAAGRLLYEVFVRFPRRPDP